MKARRMMWLAAWMLMVCLPSLASAHGSSSSYLTLAADGARLDVQWELALRDVDYAIGLDAKGDGDITWGDLRRKRDEIARYALARLKLTGDGAACPPGDVELLASQRADGGYAVLRFAAVCPTVPAEIEIGYSFLFDLDPMHRGLLRFTSGGISQAAALSPAAPSITLRSGGDMGATAAAFFVLGVGHILSGTDHLLFIAVLLLPAMFCREGGRWRPVGRFRPAFIETVRILSAFTAAHALTLWLAALGMVEIPSRLVESGIALTIVATALDNVVAFLPRRRWQLAFGFGLIHGLGFASTLGPLALPPVETATALLSFNLGIEAVQLMLASIVLPLGFLLRNVAAYPRRFLPAASGIAAVVAMLWVADRAFDIRIGSF